MSPRLGISPHTFELQVLPGEVIEQKIKIFNQSEVPIPMTTRVTDFTAEEESGQMIFDEVSQDPSFASRFWFKIENPDFILDPGEVEKVRFQIQVPDNAEPGGHYAVMIFEPKLPSFYFEEKAMVRNIPEIGVLFLFSVKKFTLEPEAEQKLEVVEFSVPKEKRLVRLENFISGITASVAQAASVSIVENPPSKFILRIKNNDIYHIKPFGKVLIYNISGKRVGESEVPQRTILPGKIRSFPVEFSPEIPKSLKWLPASVSNFLVQNLFVGKYQAKLELQAKSPVAAEVLQPTIPIILTFFSLPWKFWLSVILIFGTLMIFSFKYRERIKKAAKILISR
ncbi:MAG: hypothetical protein ACE5WD_14395 [Candidatus Aminicenantia bacterium]